MIADFVPQATHVLDERCGAGTNARRGFQTEWGCDGRGVPIFRGNINICAWQGLPVIQSNADPYDAFPSYTVMRLKIIFLASLSLSFTASFFGSISSIVVQ